MELETTAQRDGMATSDECGLPTRVEWMQEKAVVGADGTARRLHNDARRIVVPDEIHIPADGSVDGG